MLSEAKGTLTPRPTQDTMDPLTVAHHNIIQAIEATTGEAISENLNDIIEAQLLILSRSK